MQKTLEPILGFAWSKRTEGLASGQEKRNINIWLRVITGLNLKNRLLKPGRSHLNPRKFVLNLKRPACYPKSSFIRVRPHRLEA